MYVVVHLQHTAMQLTSTVYNQTSLLQQASRSYNFNYTYFKFVNISTCNHLPSYICPHTYIQKTADINRYLQISKLIYGQLQIYTYFMLRISTNIYIYIRIYLQISTDIFKYLRISINICIYILISTYI